MNNFTALAKCYTKTGDWLVTLICKLFEKKTFKFLLSHNFAKIDHI